MSVLPSVLKSIALTTIVLFGFLLVIVITRLPEGQPDDAARQPAAQQTIPAQTSEAQTAMDESATTQPTPSQSAAAPLLMNGAASSLAGKSQTAEMSVRAPRGAQPANVPEWMREPTTQQGGAAQTQAEQRAPDARTQPTRTSLSTSTFTPETAPAKQARQERAAGASSLVEALTSRGYPVHAAVSGAGSSTTLTVTGATLTRQTGAQWLGNPAARERLKAAGVRIVVLLNGQESWTFML